MTDEGHAVQSNKPIGAVMVVGGGVGGIQAALDLAESGFKVYLIEAKSAIGGHMAQLDKTFPTNDCAMCTLAPRLVEAGRHLNIEILTDTEVMDVRGQAGRFTATLRRKPRYVDVSKCIGCGDCEKVCPIVLHDPYNENLSKRHAAYRLYPQAIPAAYAIEKRGVAPCKNACPANTSAQGYVALIKERRFAEALEVIKQYNPFPATVGRVCSHPCETECSRGKVDEPISICALKRFVADNQAGEPVVAPELKYAEAIAIVGSGPAGLSCAHHLARLGYKATVFEALPVAGGMMRVGIPAYRLPRDVLDREIDDIRQEGVEIRLNASVCDIHALFRQGYKAVYLAVGAHQPQELGIPGERGTLGVHYGVAFLRRVSLGEKVELGERVVVVGGGNTAIDAARTALRVGAKEVTLLYRRTRAEMPAFAHEVADGEAEGMRVELLTAPVEVLRDNGRVRGVRCVRMKLGEPDASGRRRPVPIAGSEFEIAADALIAAVAQAPEISLLAPDHGLQVTRDGWFEVDAVTLATNIAGVYAGGDAAQGPGMLIDAIAAGRRGALSIHRQLRGLPMLTAREEQPLPVGQWTDAELEAKLARGEITRGARPKIATEQVEARVGDFREVGLGLTEAQAVAEAERCLACGLCAECYQCVKACGVNAIVHEMIERVEDVQVGAVILAPGYEVYRAELSEEFGFGRYKNVVTSLQFERLLSASGPTGGHITRPSDGKPARKIAFLQCIGSRDQTHDYCSAVCCMYAAKEAMMAKEHDRDADVHIFMMDARAFSKGYAEYYRRAQERYGVKYTRCRVSAVRENPAAHNLIVRYIEDTETRGHGDAEKHDDAETRGRGDTGASSPRHRVIASPRLIDEEFDLVVLSVGMQMSQGVRELGTKLGIALDDYGFCKTIPFRPLETSRAGIFAAGPFLEPKDIPETVMDASGAAANAEALLAQVRGALARHKEYPPERDVMSEPPRVGVFVCHCGSNIAGYLDVKTVAEYARALPNVVHTETNLYTCSQDSIVRITQVVKEHNLNRVVVAACTPRTHEPLFQDSIRAAGLNPYLFEMANIRNQCSWVHSHEWDVATEKAKDLVRASVARVSRLEPLFKVDVPLEKSALVIGGGIAGMNAAVLLAEQGFGVHLVERSGELGGKPKAQSPKPKAEDDLEGYLRGLIARVEGNPLITVHREMQVVETSGFVGNFVTRVRRAGGSLDDSSRGTSGQSRAFAPLSPGSSSAGTDETTIRHGVIIVATGAQEWRGDAYGLGSVAGVVTQAEFAERIANSELGIAKNRVDVRNSQFAIPSSVVFIQCVGPAEKYCGRLCCSETLENALRLKELNSEAQVTVLYKDIRTYGFKERLYREARERGVVFVRYDAGNEPIVQRAKEPMPAAETTDDRRQMTDSSQQSTVNSQQSAPAPRPSPLAVRVFEPMLGQELVLHPDLVVLAAPLVPREDARDLANKLKVPVDMDGWFLEAHVKLRPVDFATEGIFVAGAAHYPKFPNEAIAQAQAAAARAATILSKETLRAGGVVAQVDAAKCTGCLTCVRICPYRVPRIDGSMLAVGGIYGAAHIEAAACQGCGICAAECPAKAIELLHFKDGQVVAKVEALFSPVVA